MFERGNPYKYVDEDGHQSSSGPPLTPSTYGPYVTYSDFVNYQQIVSPNYVSQFDRVTHMDEVNAADAIEHFTEFAERATFKYSDDPGLDAYIKAKKRQEQMEQAEAEMQKKIEEAYKLADCYDCTNYHPSPKLPVVIRDTVWGPVKKTTIPLLYSSNTAKSSSSSNSYWSNFWKKAHEWVAKVKKAFEEHDKKYNSKNEKE